MKLKGIEAIEDFSEKGAADLMRYHTMYGFPMKRIHTEDSFYWEADNEDIKKWYNDRGCNPKTITEEKLKKFEIEKKLNNGEIKPIKKRLVGINEIILFSGRPTGTVIEWIKYVDCPIEIGQNNIWNVDAQSLLDWMRKHNIKRGIQKPVPMGFYQDGLRKKNRDS